MNVKKIIVKEIQSTKVDGGTFTKVYKKDFNNVELKTSQSGKMFYIEGESPAKIYSWGDIDMITF